MTVNASADLTLGALTITGKGAGWNAGTNGLAKGGNGGSGAWGCNNASNSDNPCDFINYPVTGSPGEGGGAQLNAKGHSVRVNGTLSLQGGNSAGLIASKVIAKAINISSGSGFVVDQITLVDDWDTTFTGGDSNISVNVLLLNGKKNFLVSGNDGTTGSNLNANHIKLGQLQVLNGELNDNNWHNLVGGGLTFAKPTIEVLDGGTLTLNVSSSHGELPADRQVTGAGGLTKIGSNIFTIKSNLTNYSGATHIKEGTLELSDTASLEKSVVTVDSGALFDITQISTDQGGTVAGLSGAGTVYIADKTLTVNGGGDFSGVLTNAGGAAPGTGTGGALIKSGVGTLTLSGTSNAWAGDTEIQSGKLVIAGDGSIGGGTNTIDDGATLGLLANTYQKDWTLAGAGSVEVVKNSSATNPIMNGVFSGGSLTKTGNGTLVLTAANTYTGATTINGGTLQIGNGGTTGSINTQGVSIAQGATLAFGRSDVAGSPYAFNNVISGDGNVTLMGTGYVHLTSDNSYSGTTTVSSGGLILDSDSQIGAGTNILGGDGTLVLTGSSYTKGWVLGTGTTSSNLATIETGSDVAFNGTLTGMGGLMKTGAGKLTVNHDKGYIGTTHVAQGTLEYSFARHTNLQPLTGDHLIIDSGATLMKSGTGELHVASVNLGGSTTGNIVINNGELFIDQDAAPNYAGTVTVKQGANPYDPQHPDQAFSLLGLHVQNNATTLYVDSLDFSDGAMHNRWNGIDIRGVTTDGSGQFRAEAVVSNSAILGFDDEADNIDGNRVVRALINGVDAKAGVDYLSLDAVLNTTTDGGDGKKIIVSGGLSWYATPGVAHGTFTVADKSFTVNTVLSDVTVPTNPPSSWDGKTLTKKGAGTLILTQDNTYSGKTTIEAGTLQLGNGKTTTGNLATTGGGVDIHDQATLNFDFGAGSLTFGQAISGAGQVVKTGNSTLTMTADHTFTGKLTINSGVLVVAGSLGHNTSPGKNDYRNEIEVHGVLQMSPNGEQTLSGNIYGEGGFAHYGPGTTILTGHNTWTGDTRVEQGTLIGNLPRYTELTLQNHGAVYIGGAVDSVVAASWSGSLADAPLQPVARYVSRLAGAGTVKGTSHFTAQYGDFSGVIDASNGDFYKTNSTEAGDPETLTLSGVNTYQGQTHVLEGTLALSGAGTLGNNMLNLYQGSTLDVSRADNGLDRSGREVYLRALPANPAPEGGVHATINTAAGKTVNFANATLHFEAPDDYKQDYVLLDVPGGGNVDVTNANVKLYANGTLLNSIGDGDYVTLIRSDGVLAGSDTINLKDVTVDYGALSYTFRLDAPENGNAGLLYAFYGDKRPGENAGAATYGNAARGAMVTEGFDQIISVVDHWKYSTKGKFAPSPGEKATGFSPFAATSLASITSRTGSKLRSNGFTVTGGLSWDGQLGDGDFLVGVYMDTGRGSFDAEADNNADGDGESWYYGGGLFAKYTWGSHWYVETSLRGGKAHVEYDAKDQTSNPDFSGDTPYWGAHFGAGHEYRFSETGMLDFYVKGIWQVLDDEEVTNSFDQSLRMEKYTSTRSRIGFRYIHDSYDNFRWWAGLATDYEFAGKSKIEVEHMPVDYKNSVKGLTGIGHVGFEWNSGTGWNIEAGLTGMLGVRHGGKGNLLVTYRF